MPAPIYVVPYDPSWPARFDAEHAALAPLLAPWLAGPIEHIGSTAVPGLVAKPVIDIMAAVRSLDASRPALAAVAALHYVYIPYRADIAHWLCKPSDEVRRARTGRRPSSGSSACAGRWAAAGARSSCKPKAPSSQRSSRQNGSWSPARERGISKAFAVKVASRRCSASMAIWLDYDFE